MKKLFALLLALTLLVSGMCLLVSCDDDKDNNETNNNENNENNNDDAVKVDYTVTVKDNNGDAVSGVKVTFKVGPKDSYEATSDASGKATINIVETNLPIRASYVATALPAGYIKGSATHVDFASGAKTAELEVLKGILHTVYVKNSSDAAVANASVQVCVDGVCNAAVMTDADGKAVFYVNPNFTEAYAQFNTAPEGYNAPTELKIYYTNGETEATFVVTEA
ncbi:MAG: Ig-like domain-containing protein [Clostridia bacterium]|nr:Ig-like domain-containing protein [Clostridia bacterium]